MDTNETEIRALIERWANAVHAGDIEGVLADHADEIVMFDVPPPQRGVRGIHAYERTWPPFFSWQASGAVFDIVELDVTAGNDVAFAHALLRCGKPDEIGDQRLRLTIGLRKDGNRWVVTHEHHSFPDETPDTSADERTLRDIHRQWFSDTTAKNLDGLMTHMAADIVSYEHDAPLEHVGIEQVRAVCRRGLDSAPGGVSWDVPDMQVVVDGDLAVAWGLNRMNAELADGQHVESWSRGTRVFARRNGDWVMVHQHVSYPYDPTTGEAKTDLRPDTK
jgi:ketosteroid isomerase-like protein